MEGLLDDALENALRGEDDIDDSQDDDDDDDDEKSGRLLKSLSTLASRRNKKKEEVRTEPSQLVSDYHLSQANDQVKVHELLKSLNASSKYALSKKQLKSAANKSKVLLTPLPKPQAEKLKRSVAYGKVSKEVGKWDSVVHKNRTADSLEFPLNQPLLRLQTTSTYVQKFQMKTPLELEVARLLSGSDNVAKEEKMLTPAEERALKAMSLQEARERLQELQKMRALLSYQEAKARRQNKIKSKSYHRILKKDRLKKQLAEFEIMKTSNPEEALEKLEELDKRRIEERLTLKHKNTGKWAKQNILRSKYDKQTRDALSDQLELNRQLTQKAKAKLSDDESEPETSPTEMLVEEEVKKKEELPANYNAWMRSSMDVQLPKLQENSQVPKVVRIRPKKTVTVKRKAVTTDSEDPPEEPLIIHETTNSNQEEPDDSHLEPEPAVEPKLSSEHKRNAEPEVLVDPTKFVGAKPKVLFSHGSALMDSGDEGMDNDEDQNHLTMKEAFADDDVLEEFKNTKSEDVESKKPKDLDLYLPGWGDWGGTGIVPTKRKKSRFLLKALPGPPRKDQNLGNVIINEEKETHISNHMVSELPFPFKSVQQFQTSIGHPLGSMWNTQTSFQELVRPEVTVKRGKIISPMDGDEILKNKPLKKKK